MVEDREGGWVQIRQKMGQSHEASHDRMRKASRKQRMTGPFSSGLGYECTLQVPSVTRPSCDLSSLRVCTLNDDIDDDKDEYEDRTADDDDNDDADYDAAVVEYLDNVRQLRY